MTKKNRVIKRGAKPLAHSKQMLADAAEETSQSRSAAKAAKAAPAASHEGYCMKCKDKKSVPTEGHVVHKNNMKSAHGSCPDCGTKVHRMVGKA